MIIFRYTQAQDLWWKHLEEVLPLLLSPTLEKLVNLTYMTLCIESLHYKLDRIQVTVHAESIVLQIDLKGIPLFLMTQVLRRHPMAIQYIQKNFSSRQSPQHFVPPPSPSLPCQHPFTSSTRPFEEEVSLSAFMSKTNKQSIPEAKSK